MEDSGFRMMKKAITLVVGLLLLFALSGLARAEEEAPVPATPTDLTCPHEHTREIIYFDLDGKALIADLPGYGYSAASKEVTARFSDLCDNYFRCGRKISLVLFLMDIRRDPSEEDIGMLEFLNKTGIPYLIVFTKCDKLSNAELKKQLTSLSESFDFDPDVEIFAVSSKDKKGINDLKSTISDILSSI